MDNFKLFVVFWIISFGTMLSMIGPGHSLASYVVHGFIACLPAGLLAALYVKVKPIVEKEIIRQISENS